MREVHTEVAGPFPKNTQKKYSQQQPRLWAVWKTRAKPPPNQEIAEFYKACGKTGRRTRTHQTVG